MKNTSHSNVAIALLFFVIGAGLGITIGIYHGYTIGYRNAASDKLIKSDTVIIHDFTNNRMELENE